MILFNLLRKSRVAQAILLLYLILAFWWFFIFFRGLQEGTENDLFTLMYPWMALMGSLLGVLSAKAWGGLKSIFGRALFFLSLGLFAQFFGQVAYAFYIYILGVEVPYPSIGDIGYFGSILLYIYGIVLLGKVTGAKLSLKSFKNITLSIIIPAVLLIISYSIFLKGYEYDWSTPLTVLLDFGYPLGQAIYVSIAVLVLLLSRSILGGKMRMPILFLLFALIVQYLCDYTFLFQVSRGTWYVGGLNDYMYFTSYLLMSLALIQLGNSLKEIKKS